MEMFEIRVMRKNEKKKRGEENYIEKRKKA